MKNGNKKNIILPIIAVLVVIVAAVSVAVPKLTKEKEENVSTTQGSEKSDAASAPIFTDDIIIDENAVSNTAVFYDYDTDGTVIEVFAVKASDGSTRIAFNTCQICNGSPYAYFVQQGNYFICQNCKNAFSRDDIGILHGGCNPVPVTEENYQIENEKIIIPSQFLEQYKDDFLNWKKF